MQSRHAYSAEPDGTVIAWRRRYGIFYVTP
jgi:hypothetical protein